MAKNSTKMKKFLKKKLKVTAESHPHFGEYGRGIKIDHPVDCIAEGLMVLNNAGAFYVFEGEVEVCDG